MEWVAFAPQRGVDGILQLSLYMQHSNYVCHYFMSKNKKNAITPSLTTMTYDAREQLFRLKDALRRDHDTSYDAYVATYHLLHTTKHNLLIMGHI